MLGCAERLTSLWLYPQRELGELARSMVVIWRAGGRDVDHLQSLNSEIVAEDDHVGTLFRGNSLASKAMDQVRVFTIGARGLPPLLGQHMPVMGFTRIGTHP